MFGADFQDELVAPVKPRVTKTATPAPPTPRAPPAANRRVAVKNNKDDFSAFQKVSDSDVHPVIPVLNTGGFSFTNREARAAALEAYDAILSKAEGVVDSSSDSSSSSISSLTSDHLRAWAEAALTITLGGSVGTIESAVLDQTFNRYAARQGMAGGAGAPRIFPRAIVINGASLAFLVDAAPRLRAARDEAAADKVRAAIADLNREHPRSKEL